MPTMTTRWDFIRNFACGSRCTTKTKQQVHDCFPCAVSGRSFWRASDRAVPLAVSTVSCSILARFLYSSTVVVQVGACAPTPTVAGAHTQQAVNTRYPPCHSLVALIVVQDHNSDRTTRGYVLTALTKLAGRLGEDQEDAIEALLQTYSGSMNLELQVRADLSGSRA